MLLESAILKNITAKDIGKTWLNNIIEDKTILWWGGKGHSRYNFEKDSSLRLMIII